MQMQNSARRGGAPLGLVTAPISTKNAKTLTATRGLTRLGARTLRQGAYLIESSAGKDCVTFGTATLPAVTDEELDQVGATWHEVIDRFIKRLRYHLQKKGLSGEVIHVTEIQPKRSHDEERDVPHVHFVFQGRKRKSSWAITPKQITKFWCNALQLRRITRKMCSTTCQLARVKYSVARYLSKYVAKSRSKTDDATYSSNYRRLYLKQWWGCSNSLRKLILLNTTVLSDWRGESLWRNHEKNLSSIWEYMGTIESTGNGRTVIFCRFGRLTPWARQKYLRPDLELRGTRGSTNTGKRQELTKPELGAKLSFIDEPLKRSVQLQRSSSGCSQIGTLSSTECT